MFITSKLPVSLAKLESIRFPVIMAPFYGVMIPVMVRELNQAQIQACGNFSLITTFADKVADLSRKKKPEDINESMSFMHKIVAQSLVRPTYQEIMDIYDKDGLVNKARETLKELKEKLMQSKPGPQRTALNKEIEEVKIWTEYLLPEDFTGTIVSFALGVDKSDIQKVSEEMLLEAAILAEKGHDNPSDHLDGMWPDIQKGFYQADINKRAWFILDEWKKKNNKKRKEGALEIG